jgi:Uncharacterised protein family (UPF0236)
LRKKKRLSWWCVFGKVEVTERIWRSWTCSYQRLFGTLIGVTTRGKSRALKRVLSDFGAEHSFAQAAARVKEHYGFEIQASAVRQATLETAVRAQQQLETHYAAPYRVLPAQSQPCVVAQADGTMICMVAPGPRHAKRPREWKEMRLAAAQAQGSCQTLYAASLGSVDEVGRRWAHCVRDAGWGLNSRIHVVVDGAEWISLQAQHLFGDQHRLLCDFYHVSEYLAAASTRIEPQQNQRWRKTQQRRLKRGASAQVIAELARHREPPDTPKEEAPITNAYRYLHNRRDCLDYPSALAQDLPIGSGLIESGHRHVLQARLKKAGTAWLPPTAEAMAQLRVLRANFLWHSLWN